jgi:hypothetical protein
LPLCSRGAVASEGGGSSDPPLILRFEQAAVGAAGEGGRSKAAEADPVQSETEEATGIGESGDVRRAPLRTSYGRQRTQRYPKWIFAGFWGLDSCNNLIINLQS